MLKHGSATLLSGAVLVPKNASAKTLRAIAHRHSFDYTPKPGFLYVRSRMISSRCNDNYDEFPAEEIEQSWRSFIGKPVFVNHNNDNHRRARGVIIDAALHKDALPGGAPDVWVEGLMEIDAMRFPKLARAIIARHIDRTSMGTDVAYSLCSFCGNKATTPADYCQHIPRMKGQRIYRTTANGQKVGVLVREICYGLRFFENSVLVEEPADPTAVTLGVDTRGLDMAPRQASLDRGQRIGVDTRGLNATASKTATWSYAQHAQPIVHVMGQRPPRPLQAGDTLMHPDSGYSARITAHTPTLLMLDGRRTPVFREPMEGNLKNVITSETPDDRADMERKLDVGTPEEREFLKGNPTGPSKFSAKEQDGPTHAGLVLKAGDTGRILMLQRSLQDEKDPAAGKWEFPGGGREDGDHNSLSTALREFAEEVGHPVPPGGHVSHAWQSPNGVYQGHVVVVPNESAIPLHEGRGIDNPDDPDGDYCEQSAWWHPDDAKKNPALRDEVKQSPWDEIKKAAGLTFEGFCIQAHDTGDEHIHLSDDDREFYRQMVEHGEQRREMSDHAAKAPVDLSDESALRAHLLDEGTHQWTWNNPDFTDEDTGDPLGHRDLIRAHEQEHRDYHGDWPNAVTLGGSHFHEARKTAMTYDYDTCARCGKKVGSDGGYDAQGRTICASCKSGRKAAILSFEGFFQAASDGFASDEEYKQRAAERPARKALLPQIVSDTSSREHGTTYRPAQPGEKGAFTAPSPYDEYHGPYEVIQHAQTGKFHVVDNQGRKTQFGPREGEDTQARAEMHRDNADRTQGNKEKAKGVAENLWEGLHQIFDPGSTPESRDSDRRLQTGTGLLDSGYHPHQIHYDEDGDPYAQVDHPSGWHLRDHGGNGVYLDVGHQATGDEAHDVINIARSDSETGREPGWTAKHSRDALDEWVKDSGEDYARNMGDSRIRRWNRNKGITGARVTKTATKTSTRHTAPGGGEHAPYRLKEEGGRWYVVNDRGEKKDEGYTTKAEAREHQKALYANVPGARESAEEDEKRKESRRRVGFGETKAPADVDTLRDEECPVCGESSAAYDGNECQVCGYVAPPEMFRDPDLDMAGQVDLRKDNLEQQVSDPNQDGLPSPGAPQALDQQQDAQVDQGQPVGVVDPDQITDDGVPQQQPQTDPFGNPLAPVQDPQTQGVPALDPEVQQQMQQAEGPMDADGDGSVDVEVQPTAPGQEQALPSGQPGTGGDGVPDLVCPSCGFQADSAPPQSVDTQQAVDPLTDPQQGGDGLAVGDVCPNCGQALLTSSSDMQQQQQAMGAQPVPVNDPTSPPKGREATSSRRETVEMSRPLLEAVKQQQRQITALLNHAAVQDREIVVLKSQNVYLARLAGVSPQFEAIRKRADELNPAQPVPDPASEGPSETTEQALTPEAQDNVFNLGETPGSVENLPADTTTTPMEPGVSLPTEPFNELTDVQAPVAGTETQRPLPETKTEVDVRVGDPDNPEPAFPLNPAFQNQQTTGSRAMAALRLARLRIASKITDGDDLSVAASIESGDMTPDQINHEIATLSAVVKAARREPQGRPPGLVPRAAAAQGRSTPSLAPDAPITSVAFTNDVTREVADSDLFLGDFD